MIRERVEGRSILTGLKEVTFIKIVVLLNPSRRDLG